MTPSRGTFYTDDNSVSSSRTLIASDARVRKSRSWCSDLTILNLDKSKSQSKKAQKEPYSPTIASSNVSVIHKRITSDRIAVAKGNRKDLDIDQRVAVDRILSNLPSEATAAEVERILWEGANPMVAHPEFGYFFIRAAYEMSADILEKLIEFGADLTRKAPSPSSYHSVVHAATLGRQLDTIKYLASIGHSIDAPNEGGETPLHLAVRTAGAYEVAKYLLDAGADVDHRTKDNKTPLRGTLTTSLLEGKERSMLIELLYAHGAEGEGSRAMDLRRGDSKGRSVLGI